MVQFYNDDQRLGRVVGDFLVAGLTAGEPTMLLVSPERRDLFTRELEQRGIAVEAEQQRRRLVLLDPEEALASFMVDGLPDAKAFALHVGTLFSSISAGEPARRVRAYAEMVDLLWQRNQREAAVALEKLWGEPVTTHHATMLCAYSMRSFDQPSDSAQLRLICEHHSHVMPAPSADLEPAGQLELLREITFWQQRTLALETELHGRKHLENALRVGHPISEFHVDQAVIGDLFARLKRFETVRNHEARLRCKDGSTRVVSINSNVHERDGQFVHSRCFTTDISERKRIAERTARLQTVTSALARALSSTEVASVAVEQGVIALGAQSGGLWLLSSEGAEAALVSSFGYAREGRERFATVRMTDQTPAAESMRTGQAIWVDSRVEFKSHYSQVEATMQHPEPNYGFVCLPLMVEQRCIGLVSFRFEPGHNLRSDERVLFFVLAHQCAVALERARLFEEAQLARMRSAFLAQASELLSARLARS